MTGLISFLVAATAIAIASGHPRAAAAIVVWPVALYSLIARDAWFGGQIHVWPFLLAACAIAAVYNWRAALCLAAAVGAAQFIEQKFSPAMVYQFAAYATIGFIAFGFFDKTAAATAAAVSIIYGLAALGMDWRFAMIVSEVVIVAGLTLGVSIGPTGGYYGGIRGADYPVRLDRRIHSLEIAKDTGAEDSGSTASHR